MVRSMIKSLTMLMVLVTLSLVTAVVSANAQSLRTAYANIPFDFTTGDKAMPAGEYQVRRVTPDGDAILVRAIDSSVSAVKMTNNIVHLEPSKETKLVFHRYGNQYFLSEVWVAGSTTGRQIRKSNSEKAVEHELLASQKYQRVEVALAEAR